MTARSSFIRKICYVFGMVPLLILLYFFGHPATRGGMDKKPDPGGYLAQMREDPNVGLSQTQLGEINPTSETVKLATLGMRGVAALVLWEKSNEYKMKEDWAKYEATLNQIAIVQPHLISVWIHLAWNLSYNVSVEFDDYRDRYHWVIEGIKYLQKGIENNDNDPRLYWETGWVVSQKIGRADEHKLFRKLFKEDDEFHGSTAKAERDNWLIGKKSYEDCIRVAEATGKRVKGKGPLIYNSNPAMCLMSYAEALEEEGTFGQNAKLAWENASKAWYEFGQKSIPEPGSKHLVLGELDKYEQIVKDAVRDLNALAPGLRDKIYQEKYKALSDDQRAAFETPADQRDEKQITLAAQAEAQLDVSTEEIAKRVPAEQRDKANKLVEIARDNEIIATDIRRSRDVVNFAYWKLRAEVEQEDDAVNAREKIFKGTQKFRLTAAAAAKELFNDGFLLWRKVLDKYPALIEDSNSGDDMMDQIKVYHKVLDQLDEPFPKPFILQDIVDKHGKN
jgi:hypothetical protein